MKKAFTDQKESQKPDTTEPSSINVSPIIVNADEIPAEVIKLSTIEKFINYLLCRGDLAERELSVRPVSILQLFRYADNLEVFILIGAVILAILAGTVQPLVSIITGNLINAVMLSKPNDDDFWNYMMNTIWYVGMIGLISFVVHFLQYMAFQYCCLKITSKMKFYFIQSILRQNAGWFDKNHSGELITLLHDNVERVTEGIGDKLGITIRGITMYLAGVFVGFYYEWRIALSMIGLGPLSCLCMAMMSRTMSSFGAKEIDNVSKAGKFAEESLMGVRTVQAFNGQNEMIEKYENELKKGRKFALWKGFYGGLFGGLMVFSLFLFFAIGVLYGGSLVRQKIVENPGDLFIVTMSMIVGAYFLGMISPHMMVFLNSRVSAASIYKIIDRVPDIDCESEKGKKIENVEGKVSFENVHFRYPTRKDTKVLNGFNLTIQPGTSVALVGHSGCGKSTSVSLLTKLYDPEEGIIKIDDVNINELNIKWLRQIIGIVQQEPIIFNDTVYNNLLIGNPNATREEMIEVCKMANAHDFIIKMPKGYDTLIGDGGVQLSGGQKQRVAIARTLIRNPKILLLDEATSALDAQSESVVQSALNNASKGRTTIMIAHRLSTIREADKIVFFEKGVIVESGNHEELVRLGGKYYELVKAQQFKNEPDVEVQESNEEHSNQLEEIKKIDEYRTHKRNPSIDSQLSCALSLNDHFAAFSLDNQLEGKDEIDYEEYAKEVEKLKKIDGKITSGYIDILKNAEGYYSYLFIGFLFALLRGSELFLLAFTNGLIFDALILDGDKMTQALIHIFIIMVCIGIYSTTTQTISTTLFTYVAESLALRFRVKSFQSLLNQDASFFDNPAFTPGKLISRLAIDAPNIKAVVDSRMLVVIYSSTSIILNVGSAYFYSWQIAALGTGLLIILFIISLILAFKTSKINNFQIRNDSTEKIAVEAIGTAKTIQLLTGSSFFLENLENESRKSLKQEMRKAVLNSINGALFQPFMYFMSFACYYLLVPLVYHSYISSSNGYKAINFVFIGGIAIMQMSHSFPEFVKAKTSAGLLFKFIYRKPKTGNGDEGIVNPINGNITFDSVQFSYPQRPQHPVMSKLNFNVKPGQTVALVGPSGSGKSTCISMIERFYDMNGGCISIDGEDIRSYSLDYLRTQISLVGQEPRLFSGSIRDNVSFGLKDVPMEKINEALELANATRFLSSLPAGIDTDVGEKGSQLSGGQKQRIAIARALVRDPKILLLDEATSALDSESERAVQEALDRARAGRTCITIAHRLSSIQNSDLIIYIENGETKESGTHNELIALKGKYYDLIKKQDLAF